MGIEEEKPETLQDDEREVPLCLNCLRPVNPLNYYCPHCGEATGQLTPIIPFVNIPWQVRIWSRIWQQVWSKDVSFPCKLFRVFMIIWFVPVILIGIIPKLWQNKEAQNDK